MDLSISDYVLVGIAILISSFVQASVGFGSGLVAIPLMLLAGVDLAVAVTINLLTSTIQNVLGLRRHWSAIEWSSSWHPMLLRLGFLPVGVAALFAYESLFGEDKSYIRMAVGVVILLTLLTQAKRPARDESRPAAGWSYVAFPLSGIMQGLVGLAGPPMVIWVIAQNWSPDRSRGFLFLMLISTVPFHLLLFSVIWPQQVLQALLLFLLAIPISVLATFAGLAAGRRLSRRWLRRLAYVLLFAIAANCLLEPWF